MTQEEIDAKVAEFMAESVVVDSMNEAYVYNAMNALRDVAENYYRWGMEDAQEQMMKEAYTGVYDCDDDTSWIGFKGWLLSTSKVGKKVKLVIIEEE